MKETGTLLKQAREEQKLSISEASLATKINAKMLTAIESGDLANLPAKTFLRGFVRSYAAYLKMDLEVVLKKFHEEMGSTLVESAATKEPAVESAEDKKLPDLEKQSNMLRSIAIVGIVILIILIFSVKKIVEKYEREGTVEPHVASDTIADAPKETSTEEPKTKPAEEPSTGEKDKVDAKTAEVAPAPTSKPTPPPTPALAVTPTPTNTSAETKELVKPSPSPDAEATSNIATSHPVNEIILEALDNVDISFRISGGNLTRVSLKPDQVHTIKAKGPINLDLSDGGAVSIVLNGRDLGPPGDLGKPKKVRIP